MSDHEPGCPLSAAPWLPQAAGADPSVDRVAAGALTEALAGLPEMDVLADARLDAALRRRLPAEDDLRLVWCRCRHRPDRPGSPPGT